MGFAVAVVVNDDVAVGVVVGGGVPVLVLPVLVVAVVVLLCVS